MCKTFTWHHWMVTSRAVQLNTWQVTKQNSNTCMDCRPFRKHENKMFDVADTFAFSSHTLRSHNWTSRTLYQTCLYFIYTGFFRWLSDFYEGLRERRKTEQRKKTSNENLESKNAFFVCVCLCADTLWLLLKLYRNESWKEIDFEHFGSYYFLWKNVLPLYSGSTFFLHGSGIKVFRSVSLIFFIWCSDADVSNVLWHACKSSDKHQLHAPACIHICSCIPPITHKDASTTTFSLP